MGNGNTNTSFVAANVTNSSAKFKRQPAYDFRGDEFWYLFANLAFLLPIDCHGNKSNSAVLTKFTCFVVDYLRNISVKKYMSNVNKNLANVMNISVKKHMSNVSKYLANVMNISANCQLHPPYGFWEADCLIFFCKFSFRLPWEPIKFSGLDKIHMLCRRLLKESFCKTFVKISAMR